MNEQPAAGIHRAPGKFTRHEFQKGQRLASFVSKQKVAQPFVKTLLQPLHFRPISLVLAIGKAADTTLLKIVRPNDDESCCGHRNPLYFRSRLSAEGLVD